MLDLYSVLINVVPPLISTTPEERLSRTFRRAPKLLYRSSSLLQSGCGKAGMWLQPHEHLTWAMRHWYFSRLCQLHLSQNWWPVPCRTLVFDEPCQRDIFVEYSL